MASDFDLSTVFESYDLPTGTGQRKIRCPFPDHPDRTPSFSVHYDKGVWNCPVCGIGGGIYQFIEMYEGVTRDEARTRAEKMAGGSLPVLSGKSRGGSSLLPGWARNKYIHSGALPVWASTGKRAA